MKIAIAIVLVLAAYAFAATYTLSSYSSNSITMTINAPSATTTSHNLTMVTTWATAFSIADTKWANVLCVGATDGNYTLTAAATYSGFAYDISCAGATSGTACSDTSGTLTEAFYTSAITYTSDTSITVTTATAATSVAGTPVKAATSFTDTSTIATAISGLPLANATAATYHVCWSSVDSTVDLGATGSAITVANRYNVTISSAFNSLSLTGLAIASAAIVSLF